MFTLDRSGLCLLRTSSATNLPTIGAHALLPFVSCGYVCIEPNVRGSTGYGIDLQKANFKDLGDDLQDEVFAAQFLEVTGYVAPRRALIFSI
jgi:dipeptidyl aminopeptidase/acylaminoacyl peptidase